MYLTGHSKGGNLAVYAAAKAERTVQDRLLMVFSFDGPGLDDETIASEGYRHVEPLIRSYVPSDSIVGMLMNYYPKYCVVQSNSFSILQHDPFNWKLAGNHFLEAEKVSTEGMVVRKGHTSAIAYCWIDAPTGKRSVAWTRGTLTELTADEVNLELVRQAKILHLDGHNPAAALAAAKEARKHNIPVCLDAGTLRDGVRELLPYVTILIASEAFARLYTGENDLDKAIFKLREIGAEVTGITMGKEGSMTLDGDKILRCPAFRIDPVDTTGAGDVYHAGFGVRYLETHDLMDCMRFASAVSAIKCLKLGGRAGIPTRAQVDEFLKSH